SEQSSILALASAVGAMGLSVALAGTEPKLMNEFVPFSVFIEPSWGQILLDHNIVDQDGWVRVRQRLLEARTDTIGTLRFTALGENLFYGNERTSFFRELEVTCDLDDVWPEEMKKRTFGKGSAPIGPRIHLKEVFDPRTRLDVWQLSL